MDRAGASGRQNEEECAPPLGRRSDMQREGKSCARKGTREATKFAPFEDGRARAAGHEGGRAVRRAAAAAALNCHFLECRRCRREDGVGWRVCKRIIPPQVGHSCATGATRETKVRRALFDIDEAVAYLNGCAFGAIPRPIQRVRNELVSHIEQNPYAFHRNQAPRMMQAAKCAVRASWH